MPGMQGLNSVSPLPGGGFVTTNFAARGGNAVAAAVWRTLEDRCSIRLSYGRAPSVRRGAATVDCRRLLGAV